jgi:branched-chain amino acid transport system substrate-binding protein
VGIRETEDLIENQGAEIIIGAVSSEVTLGIAPICQAKGVLLLSPSSSAPKITEAGDFIFRNFPSDVLEGTAMADFAKDRGVRRVVIFAVDDEFGAGLTEVFGRRFESKSRKVIEKFLIPEGDPAALAEMVAKVKELNPEGVYVVAYEAEIVSLLQELHAAEIRPLIMATASVTQKIPGLAGEAAENLVYPQPSFDIGSGDPPVATFVEAYRERYDEDPGIYAAHGYDALKLIWQAMLDTGHSRPDEIKRGLLGLESYHGAAGRTSFDSSGDVVRYPQLFVVRDGQPVPYEEFEQEGGELPVPGRG